MNQLTRYSWIVPVVALALGGCKASNVEALGEMSDGVCSRAAACANAKKAEGCSADVKDDLQKALNISPADGDKSSPCSDSELEACKSAIQSMSCDKFELNEGNFKLKSLPTACSCK